MKFWLFTFGGLLHFTSVVHVNSGNVSLQIIFHFTALCVCARCVHVAFTYTHTHTHTHRAGQGRAERDYPD